MHRYCIAALIFVAFNSGHCISERDKDIIQLDDGTGLVLFGIGQASEFRTDTYIAKLYGPNYAEDVTSLFRPSLPKAMHLRFVIESYSFRKASRHFKERIALNSSRNDWIPLTDSIVRFTDLFTQDFKKGDEIRIEYLPEQGITVYINNVQLETFMSPDFMTLLLNVWIGKVPLSKQFDLGIRGLSNSAEVIELRTKFNALNPVEGRFLSGRRADIDNPEFVVTISEDSDTKETAIAANQQSRVTTNPQSRSNTTKTDNVDPPTSPIQMQSQINENEQAKNRVSDDKEVALGRSKLLSDSVSNSGTTPIDPDLIRGSFTRELIEQVQAKRFYPRNALRLRQQGQVTASVSINKMGLVDQVEIAVPSGSRLLDGAVYRIIEEAAPFPEIPDELREDIFSFDVTITFKL